jgi:beta-mannanase
MRRPLLFFCLLAPVMLAVMLGVPGHDPARAAATRTPAPRGTLFGLNVPSPGQLAATESAVGARAAIVGTFADWASAPAFPRSWADAVTRHGAVPLISWEPWDSERGGTDQPDYALATIAGGAHDALIDRWARAVKAFGHPVMLRFAAEMNGDWLPWSTGVNGNRPGDYVAAWAHVRDRFARVGARNAIWVWNPIIPSGATVPLTGVFPGADAVDWVAVDGYNWGATRSWGWQSYTDIFTPAVAELRSLAPGRPVMIAETGSAPDARKPAWIADTLRRARTDRVDAVVWFEFRKETDWRLAANPASASAARAALQQPGWVRGGDLGAVERAVRRGR